MKKARRNAKRRRTGLAPWRLGTLAGASLIGFGLLGARAAQLQAVDSARLAQIAARQSHTTLRMGPQRVEILDRHGRSLAMSAGVESVAVLPSKLQDRDATAARLARVMGLKTRDVRRRIDSGRSFVWVQRWVSPDTAKRVRQLDLPGVLLEPERRRFYPSGELAAAYIGVADRDGRGLTGLELAFDTVLRRESATLPARRDARGVKLLHGSEEADTSPHKPLRLTLDARLQHSAERALTRALASTGSRSGVLVALDPRNGDLLAVAHAPGFEPNRFWLEDPTLFRARAFVDSFEPGSTLKPFSIAIAIDAGVVDADDAFDCENGEWRVLNRTIHDMKPHEVLSVHDILRVSSNIGAAKIAARLGSAELVAGLARFGFGEPTGSGFPGESSGRLHQLRERQEVERANLAFGQGVSVTALQLASATAVLANGGRRVIPRLALPDADARSEVAASGDRVVSARTAGLVMSMLRAAVASGTGRKADLPDYAVAGKTGTAQKVVDGTYSPDRHVASFVGVLPSLNPRLVVVVVLDEPEGAYAGGEVAAPVFREFAGSAVRQLGIPTGGAE